MYACMYLSVYVCIIANEVKKAMSLEEGRVIVWQEERKARNYRVILQTQNLLKLLGKNFRFPRS